MVVFSFVGADSLARAPKKEKGWGEKEVSANLTEVRFSH